MYYRHKGILPNITALIGFLIPGLFLVGGLRLIALYLHDLSSGGFSVDDLFRAIEAILVLLLVVFPFPFLLGWFFSAMFPDIRIIKSGLKYRFYGLISGLIRWNEIERLVNLPGGHVAIVIARKGLPLLNGLFVNKLYGRVFRYDYPILIMSPSLEGREEIIRLIGEMIKKYSADHEML